MGILQWSVATLHVLSHSDWRRAQHPQGPQHPSQEVFIVKLGPIRQQSGEIFHLPLHYGHSWGRLPAQDE